MTSMSVATLATEIKRQKALKKDFLATSGSGFEMTPDGGYLDIDGQSDMRLRDYAHGDLATFTEIPKIYYDRMRRDDPHLLATNVNTWLHSKIEPRLIRTLDGEVRCIRSNSYRPLDHDELIKAVMPALAEHPGIKIQSCELTERKLYLKAVLPKLEFEVKKGDIVQFGLSISNSEIGQGALEVAIFALRLICLNGAVMEDGKQRKNHIGGNLGDEVATEYLADETRQKIDEAFFLKLRDTTKHMLSEAAVESSVNKMKAAAGEKITVRPDKLVYELGKRYAINQDESDKVLDLLMASGDLTQWGLANAVTALAKNEEDSDRGNELQHTGGKIISLNGSEWSRIAEAA